MEKVKEKNLLTGAIVIGLALVLVAIAWIICAVCKVGMYAPKPVVPYTFVSEQSIEYAMGEEDGDEVNYHLYVNVKVSGTKLQKIAYSVDGGTTYTDINGKTFAGADDSVTIITDSALLILVNKSEYDGENISHYNVNFMAYDTDGNTETLNIIQTK